MLSWKLSIPANIWLCQGRQVPKRWLICDKGLCHIGCQAPVMTRRFGFKRLDFQFPNFVHFMCQVGVSPGILLDLGTPPMKALIPLLYVISTLPDFEDEFLVDDSCLKEFNVMKKSLHGSPSNFKFFGNCSLDETLWKVMKGNGWLNTFPLIFSVKFKIRALVFLSFCKIWSLLLLTRSSGKTLILSSGLRSVAIMKLMWSFFFTTKGQPDYTKHCV